MERKKIERKDILKAIEREQLVIARHPARPDVPYQGRILKETKKGLWFKGFSGSEELKGNIRAEDIIEIYNICSKTCMICRTPKQPVETRICTFSLCGSTAFFWDYCTENEKHLK